MARPEQTPHPPPASPVGPAFVKRVLTVIALVALAFLLWKMRLAFLLVFGALIFAVLLLAATRPLERRAGISHRLALAIVCLALLAAVALLGWLVGSQVSRQVTDLLGRLPEAWGQFQEQAGVAIPLSDLLGQGTTEEGQEGDPMLRAIASAARSAAGQLASYGYLLVQGVTVFVLVLIGGVYLAARPGLYRAGIVKLFPRTRQAQVEETLSQSGRILQLWLLAQLMSMAVVGVLTGLGAWAIGLPAPLALGLIAGLLQFVPIVGPILSAVPALLVALTDGWSMVLWTLLLYVGIQQVESDIITPLIQQRMVTIPAGLLLFAIVAVSAVFGSLGVLVASPLAVVAYQVTKKVYVQDTLGHETELPGAK